MLPFQSFCQHLPTIFARRIYCHKKTALSKLLIFFPGMTFRHFQHFITICSQQTFQIAGFIQSKIASCNRDRMWIFFVWFQRIIHGFPEFLIRSQTMFLHDRIHIAPYKINIRESGFQFMINRLQITAHKVMETHCKKQHCLWLLRKSVQHI